MDHRRHYTVRGAARKLFGIVSAVAFPAEIMVRVLKTLASKFYW